MTTDPETKAAWDSAEHNARRAEKAEAECERLRNFGTQVLTELDRLVFIHGAHGNHRARKLIQLSWPTVGLRSMRVRPHPTSAEGGEADE